MPCTATGLFSTPCQGNSFFIWREVHLPVHVSLLCSIIILQGYTEVLDRIMPMSGALSVALVSERGTKEASKDCTDGSIYRSDNLVSHRMHYLTDRTLSWRRVFWKVGSEHLTSRQQNPYTAELLTTPT